MKNGRIRIALIILLVIISSIAVTACEAKSPLVGKWKIIEEDKYGEVYIEFSSDGKYEMVEQQASFTGTYKGTGENQVTLTADDQNTEFAEEGEKLVLNYSLSGDELILSDGETPIAFTRVE